MNMYGFYFKYLVRIFKLNVTANFSLCSYDKKINSQANCSYLFPKSRSKELITVSGFLFLRFFSTVLSSFRYCIETYLDDSGFSQLKLLRCISPRTVTEKSLMVFALGESDVADNPTTHVDRFWYLLSYDCLLFIK
jgi:hypothetical protein